tara:strand:+ start:221 stop:424 length:204 start_codon:yes stop_codon:yes gene_type:complete
MPAHNVNTAALEQVVDAARRFEQLTETLNLAPVDEEDFPLSGAIRVMEKVLEIADPNGPVVPCKNGH